MAKPQFAHLHLHTEYSMLDGSVRISDLMAKVSELGGHKSLYSEAFYAPDDFDRLYGGAELARVKALHDPDDRLTSLYDKVVRRR